MKILLDHNLDRKLKNFLPAYDTTTAQECGWVDVQNGELLLLAEETNLMVCLPLMPVLSASEPSPNEKGRRE